MFGIVALGGTIPNTPNRLSLAGCSPAAPASVSPITFDVHKIFDCCQVTALIDDVFFFFPARHAIFDPAQQG